MTTFSGLHIFKTKRATEKLSKPFERYDHALLLEGCHFSVALLVLEKLAQMWRENKPPHGKNALAEVFY